MPISGLVITLDAGAARPAGVESALESMRLDARLTIGRIENPPRVPVVLETRTDDEHRAALRGLERLPGVALVEVAYVDLSDLKEQARHGD